MNLPAAIFMPRQNHFDHPTLIDQVPCFLLIDGRDNLMRAEPLAVPALTDERG